MRKWIYKLGKEVKQNEGFENRNALHHLCRSPLLFRHGSGECVEGESSF